MLLGDKVFILLIFAMVFILVEIELFLDEFYCVLKFVNKLFEFSSFVSVYSDYMFLILLREILSNLKEFFFYKLSSFF